MDSESLTVSVTEGQTYKMAFEVNGSTLTGRLYDSTGALLATVTATDASYSDGSIGTWAKRNDEAIDGSWAHLSLSPAFPVLTQSAFAANGTPATTGASVFVQTADSGNLHVKDAAAANVKVAVGSGASGIGDNYAITSNITFINTTTELGLLARGDLAGKEGYVLSFDPVTCCFKLLKLSPSSGALSSTSLASETISSLTVNAGDTFSMSFDVNGGGLVGKLYNSTGGLLSTISAVDSTYTTGDVGAWACQQSGVIDGRWSSLRLGYSSAGGSPSDLVNVNGTLFYVATDAAYGAELWKTDGTAAGTVRVADIASGSVGSSPADLTAVGSLLYFTANDGSNGRELWKYDPASGVATLIDINTEAGASSAPANLTAMGNTLFFTATNSTYGTELWAIVGTSSPSVINIAAGVAGSSPSNLTVMGVVVNGTKVDRLFFTANEGTSGSNRGAELWTSDGTTAGTTCVLDIVTGTGSSNPGNLAVVRSNSTATSDALFFTAWDATHGVELWKSNGTAAGTACINICDDSSAVTSSYPSKLTAVGNTLFFTATTSTAGTELWKSDGTLSGTECINICSDATAVTSSYPSNLTAVGNTLFFTATEGTNGTELWKYQSGAASLAKDIRTGDYISSSPANLTNVNGVLYFTATDATGGNELWKSDGTAAGTVRVKDICEGFGGSSVSDLTVMGNVLFFAATDAAGNRRLWKSNGTAAGTVPVVSGNADSLAKGDFRIEQSTDGKNYTEVGSSQGLHYVASDLAPDTTYYFRVSAYDNDAVSAYSEPICVTIGSTAAPTAPTLTAGNCTTASDSVTLNWTDNSGNETGFVIEQSSDNWATHIDVALVPHGYTSYKVTGLWPSTSYQFRVVAYNDYDGGSRAESSSVTLTTVAGTAAPKVVTAAAATLNDAGTVVTLTVLGDNYSAGGEADLTYTWTATDASGAPVALSFAPITLVDGLRQTTASLASLGLGTYTFTVTIRYTENESITSTAAITIEPVPTSISLDTPPASLCAGSTCQFKAVVIDQFGDEMATPLLTWSETGDGSIDANGLYTTPTTPGTVTITATCSDGRTANTISTTPRSVTIAPYHAAATLNTAGTAAALSVAESASAPSDFLYTWAITSKPDGAADPVFSGATNGTHSASQLTATFSQAGDYVFTVTMTGGSPAVTLTSTVAVTVDQELTTVVVWPASYTSDTILPSYVPSARRGRQRVVLGRSLGPVRPRNVRDAGFHLDRHIRDHRRRHGRVHGAERHGLRYGNRPMRRRERRAERYSHQSRADHRNGGGSLRNHRHRHFDDPFRLGRR